MVESVAMSTIPQRSRVKLSFLFGAIFPSYVAHFAIWSNDTKSIYPPGHQKVHGPRGKRTLLGSENRERGMASQQDISIEDGWHLIRR
jgi:hypothetical protein